MCLRTPDESSAASCYSAATSPATRAANSSLCAALSAAFWFFIYFFYFPSSFQMPQVWCSPPWVFQVGEMCLIQEGIVWHSGRDLKGLFRERSHTRSAFIKLSAATVCRFFLSFFLFFVEELARNTKEELSPSRDAKTEQFVTVFGEHFPHLWSGCTIVQLLFRW